MEEKNIAKAHESRPKESETEAAIVSQSACISEKNEDEVEQKGVGICVGKNRAHLWKKCKTAEISGGENGTTDESNASVNGGARETETGCRTGN